MPLPGVMLLPDVMSDPLPSGLPSELPGVMSGLQRCDCRKAARNHPACRFTCPIKLLHLQSNFFEAVANAIQRFDHIEIIVGLLEFFAQAFDMAVDGAIVDIHLIIVSRIH